MALARIEPGPTGWKMAKVRTQFPSRKQKLWNGCRPPLSTNGSAGIREIILSRHDFLKRGNRASGTTDTGLWT